MTPEKILQQLQPWIAQHRRTAWIPKVAETAGPPNGSRYGGQPWLSKGAEHPGCGHCRRPLRLLLQLDLGSLPEGARGALPSSGLFQAFYCEHQDCESEVGGSVPFSELHSVRVVEASAETQPAAPVEEPFPAKAIVGWEAKDDLPSAAEHEDLGLSYDYDFKAKTVKVRCPAVGLDSPPFPLGELEAEQISQAVEGDKLRGWPYWIQGPEYPQCPRCASRMETIFQIESEKNLPYMWGDAGIVQLSQCKQHPEVLALNWSCA